MDMTKLVTQEMKEAETALQAQATINSEARAYLTETDWYVSRLTETGLAVPIEILEARAAARLEVK